MAVVDALEHLLHEHGRVFFSELAPFLDLIEKLSSFANPKRLVWEALYLLGHYVEPFFVLEKLVHLDDIGVIDLLEDCDFIHEHLLFYLVDVGFFHDFHGPLWLCLSVDTEPDLTERTYKRQEYL